MRLPVTVRRTVAVSSAVLAAVAAAFAAGVAVGSRATPERRAAAPTALSQAESLLAGTADAAVPRSALDAAAIQGMLSRLDDRWATYYGVGDGGGSYGQLRALLAGEYSGLGVWLRRAHGARQLVVDSVTAGSPAAAAGVQVGDELIAVDGRSLAGVSLPAVVDALHGPPGSAVTLTLRRAGVLRHVALRRSTVSAEDVTVDTVAAGVRRIRVAAFSRGAGRAVAAAVHAAQRDGVRGLVIDLRGDPGGLLQEAVDAAGALLDGGPVVSVAGRGVAAQTIAVPPGGNTALPVAVLVDGGTASAAEVLTAALQDRDRAVVVGSRTFGKGSVQQPTQLVDGSALEFTVAHYRTPNGRSLDGVGITPDVPVDPAADPGVAVSRAVALLDGLVAVRGTSPAGVARG